MRALLRLRYVFLICNFLSGRQAAKKKRRDEKSQKATILGQDRIRRKKGTFLYICMPANRIKLS
jgi:hypothetical protein